MALIPHSGSLTPPSAQVENPNRTDLHENIPVVRNSAVERTAFNTADYPQDSKQILAYMEGSRLIVTYYWREPDVTIARGGSVDSVYSRHAISDPLSKIRSFELFVSSDFSHSYDPTITERTYTGQATTYPGFIPYIGDEFYMDSGSGNIFVMEVTNVEPLSIHADSAYTITFRSAGSLVPTNHEAREARVYRSLRFNSTIYLAGNRVLLTDETFDQYTQLTRMRTVLARYYFNKFYKSSMDTIIRQDNVYDPYVIFFIHAVVPFELVKVRPTQLLPDCRLDYQKTIWYRLLDNHNRSLVGVVSANQLAYKSNAFNDIAITGLINRPYVLIQPDISNDDTCINPTLVYEYGGLSNSFYAGNVEEMTEFEKLIYHSLINKVVVDVNGLINDYINTYHTLTDEEAFYRIPLLLYLIDLIIPTYARSHLL